MCTPILLAGAALAVGSAVANTVASNSQSQARNDVLAAERIRQSGFNQETTALNNQSRDRFVDFVPQQAGVEARLGDILGSKVAGDPNTTAPSVLPSSTSAVVNQETAKQEANAQGYVDQQAGALAHMRSFGDLLGEISTKQARDAAQIGQVGGFKSASQNIVPLELDNASHAGDGWSTLGDILGGLSSVGVSAGTSGAFGNPFGNLFTPKTFRAGLPVAGGALGVT